MRQKLRDGDKSFRLQRVCTEIVVCRDKCQTITSGQIMCVCICSLIYSYARGYVDCFALVSAVGQRRWKITLGDLKGSGYFYRYKVGVITCYMSVCVQIICMWVCGNVYIASYSPSNMIIRVVNICVLNPISSSILNVILYLLLERFLSKWRWSLKD